MMWALGLALVAAVGALVWWSRRKKECRTCPHCGAPVVATRLSTTMGKSYRVKCLGIVRHVWYEYKP